MIETRLAALRARLAAQTTGEDASGVAVVAATKDRSAAQIRRAFAAGVRIAGENRVQEMREKLAQDAYAGMELHFIGHLQTNKAKCVVGRVSLIQSVDSLRLACEIDRLAQAAGIVQDILLEINIGGEESKHGFAPEDVVHQLDAISKLRGIRVLGLMTVAPKTEEISLRRVFFAKMRQLFVDITPKKYDNIEMRHLSMGMSMDYAEAIAEGSNMIRVGTGIFGSRDAL